MKHTIISLIIFGLLSVFVTYSHITLLNVCDDIISSCESLEESLEDNDWEKTYDDSVSLLDYIEEHYKSISLYINHQELDNLSFETIKLSQYIECKEVPESFASVHLVKKMTESIRDVQIPSIGNIF